MVPRFPLRNVGEFLARSCHSPPHFGTTTTHRPHGQVFGVCFVGVGSAGVGAVGVGVVVFGFEKCFRSGVFLCRRGLRQFYVVEFLGEVLLTSDCVRIGHLRFWLPVGDEIFQLPVVVVAVRSSH